MIRRRRSDDAQSFDDAWTTGVSSGTSAEVAELIRTAEALCRTAVAQPDPEFRSALRSQLMAEAATVLVDSPAPARAEAPAPKVATHPVRRRVIGLTAAAVAAVGSVGMISSSATAVPGDVLYPVKRGVESVQLALHRDNASRGEFQLDQARERLAEAWWLDSHDQDDRVARALEDFSDQASSGSSNLFLAYGDARSTTTIDTVNDFAASATVTLANMSDDLPDDARAALDLAADTISGLASQASALCTSCAPADLSSLVKAVDGVSRQTPADTAPAPSDGSGNDTATGPSTSQPGSSPTGQASKPAAPSGGSTPIPTPTPLLSGITDPLLGGLLGDEEQEGLVPGLLGGLLGGKNN